MIPERCDDFERLYLGNVAADSDDKVYLLGTTADSHGYVCTGVFATVSDNVDVGANSQFISICGEVAGNCIGYLNTAGTCLTAGQWTAFTVDTSSSNQLVRRNERVVARFEKTNSGAAMNGFAIRINKRHSTMPDP